MMAFPPAGWTTDFAKLSAKELEVSATFLMREEDTFVPNTNEYAESIKGTMNLRKWFEWEHNISNGFLHHHQRQNLEWIMVTWNWYIRKLPYQWIVFTVYGTYGII